MSQDISQWLAEIKSLQQQLADAIRDRDAANASATKWRSLYETEAQQRRTEVSLAQQTVDSLKAEIERLKQGDVAIGAATTDRAILQAEIGQLATIEAIQQKLLEALEERDRLVQALKLEKADHAQTRKSLTAALGDTVDQLARERAKSSGSTSEEAS